MDGSAGKRGASILVTLIESKLTISSRMGTVIPKVRGAVASSSFLAKNSSFLKSVRFSLPLRETPIASQNELITVAVYPLLLRP